MLLKKIKPSHLFLVGSITASLALALGCAERANVNTHVFSDTNSKPTDRKASQNKTVQILSTVEMNQKIIQEKMNLNIHLDTLNTTPLDYLSDHNKLILAVTLQREEKGPALLIGVQSLGSPTLDPTQGESFVDKHDLLIPLSEKLDQLFKSESASEEGLKKSEFSPTLRIYLVASELLDDESEIKDFSDIEGERSVHQTIRLQDVYSSTQMPSSESTPYSFIFHF